MKKPHETDIRKMGSEKLKHLPKVTQRGFEPSSVRHQSPLIWYDFPFSETTSTLVSMGIQGLSGWAPKGTNISYIPAQKPQAWVSVCRKKVKPVLHSHPLGLGLYSASFRPPSEDPRTRSPKGTPGCLLWHPSPQIWDSGE